MEPARTRIQHCNLNDSFVLHFLTVSTDRTRAQKDDNNCKPRGGDSRAQSPSLVNKAGRKKGPNAANVAVIADNPTVSFHRPPVGTKC